MKKTLCVFLALFLTLSLLSVPALADGEDSSFEPVTVADDESVKVVVTDLVNSPEDSSASFTLEITNKTEMGLEFSLTAFSANDRICPLSWIDGPGTQYGKRTIDIPAGETESVSAGWDKPSLAQVGVNYVRSAEGYLSVKWSMDYYMTKSIEAGNDSEALAAIDDQYFNFELRVPVSLPFPAVDMDVPATEEVIYDTAFAPVTVVDDENITAVIQDCYFDSSDDDSGPALVISVENKTGEMLRVAFDEINGNYLSYDSHQWIPSQKTLLETIHFFSARNDGAASTESMKLHFSLVDENNLLYGGYSMDLAELDISPYANATSSVHGTAAWVADPTPPETPQPTVEPVEEDMSSADAESAELFWTPDPETDANAMVTLGDNDEYLIGMTYNKSFPGIIVYFENISGAPVSRIYSTGVTINGESIDGRFGSFGDRFIVRPGNACNYALGDTQPALPSDGFEMQIELEFYMEGYVDPFLDATLNVAFAEDGSATIEQVS